MRHRINKYTRKFVPVAIENRQGTLWIIERDDDHIVEYTGRRSMGNRDTSGLTVTPPVRRVRGLADLDVVVLAVIGALDLRDFGTARVRP